MRILKQIAKRVAMTLEQYYDLQAEIKRLRGRVSRTKGPFLVDHRKNLDKKLALRKKINDA
jgi:hypothetical protein